MDEYKMDDTESFGTVLRDLLRRHDRARGTGPRLTAATLAARLRVDASLVRRWLRGERVPPVRSGRVGQIAEVLQLSPEERRRLDTAHLYALSLLARGATLPQAREERAAGVARVLDDTAGNVSRNPLPDHLR